MAEQLAVEVDVKNMTHGTRNTQDKLLYLVRIIVTMPYGYGILLLAPVEDLDDLASTSGTSQ